MRNPRFRTIKPDLGDSRDIAKVSREARYFFVLLLCWLDDEGRAEWAPKLYSGLMYAHDEDVSAVNVNGWLKECADAGLLIHYTVEEQEYIAAPNFTKHQKIDRPSPSEFPAPPGSETLLVEIQARPGVAEAAELARRANTQRDLSEETPTPQEANPEGSTSPGRGLDDGSPNARRGLDEGSSTREGVGEGIGKGVGEGDKPASQPARGDHPADQHFEMFFRIPACQRARKTASDETMLEGFRLAFERLQPHVETANDWPGWSDFLERFVECMIPDRYFGKNSVGGATPGMVLRERFVKFLLTISPKGIGKPEQGGIDWDAIAKAVDGDAA